MCLQDEALLGVLDSDQPADAEPFTIRDVVLKPPDPWPAHRPPRPAGTPPRPWQLAFTQVSPDGQQLLWAALVPAVGGSMAEGKWRGAGGAPAGEFTAAVSGPAGTPSSLPSAACPGCALAASKLNRHLRAQMEGAELAAAAEPAPAARASEASAAPAHLSAGGGRGSPAGAARTPSSQSRRSLANDKKALRRVLKGSALALAERKLEQRMAAAAGNLPFSRPTKVGDRARRSDPGTSLRACRGR